MHDSVGVILVEMGMHTISCKLYLFNIDDGTLYPMAAESGEGTHLCVKTIKIIAK